MNSETRTIGGSQVTASQMSSTDSYRMLPKVMKMIAPMVGVGFTSESLVQAISVIESDTDQKFLQRVMSCVTVKRAGKVYELANSELIDVALPDIADLVDAFRLSIEVNYKSFLSRGLAAMGAAPAKADDSNLIQT